MNKISERHKEIQSFIKKYLEKVNLGTVQQNNEVEKVLNYTSNDIKKLDPEDCIEAAILLNRTATYIQIKINTLSAEINWATKVIERLIADKVHEYGGQYSPMQYRKELAIKDNDITEKLNQAVVIAQLELDSLQYLPAQLNKLSNSYEKAAYNKQNQK